MSVTRFFSSFFMQPLYQLNSSGANYSYITTGSYGAYYTSYSDNLNSPPRRPLAFHTSTGYPGLIFNQQTIEQYYAILDMLAEMYMFNVAGLVTRFIADTIIEAQKTTPHIYINMDDQKMLEQANKIVNSWLDKVDIVKIVKMIMNDIIYYGSYSFHVDNKYNLHSLYDPYSVVSVIGANMNEIGYLVNTNTGIVFLPKSKAKILRIGIPDLILYSDIFYLSKSEYEEYVEQFNTPRTKTFSKLYDEKNKFLLDPDYRLFARPYMFMAACPLFYFSRSKLREYVIKDVVLGLITLRDLLYPIVFMMQYEYPAINYTVQSLADQIEEILNAYADISGFLGVRSNLVTILSAITYSIRVLPDFKGYISNLSPLETSKLTEKLDKYRGEMKELLEEIANDIGWPTDSFNSRITYWESMRQSERINAKVTQIVQSIEKSLSIFLSRMVCEKMKIPYNDKIVQISLFDLTISRLSRMATAQETISTYLDGVTNTLDNIMSFLEEKEYINAPELINVIKSYIQYILPEPDVTVNWQSIIEKREKAKQESEEELEDEGFDDLEFELKEAPKSEEESSTEEKSEEKEEK